MDYKHAIIGGTFDHFHIGHQAMLRRAFEVSEKVTIGITTEQMYGNKHLPSQIEKFEQRENAVKKFLQENNWLSQAILLPIDNKYGSSLTDNTIEAIIVSPETESIAKDIAKERTAKGLTEVVIISVPFVLSSDGEIVSSERIRRGEIHPDGSSYLHFLQSKSQFYLPDSLRNDLKQPIGDITTTAKEIKSHLNPASLLISIGDIVTTTLMKDNIIPNISIVDFRTQRKTLDASVIRNYFPNVQPALTNLPGTINTKFIKILSEKINSQPKDEVVRVDGEEDLLTLPAILLSPLGTNVIYGQYNIGMIFLEVTQEKKDLIFDLLKRFK